MRSLGGKVQESTFCDILHNAVLQVCREKYWADSPDWEVDGVICISVPHSQEQHVVKIHQKFPSDSGKHFDNRCFECDRKPKDALSTNETSERHFNESVEEDDSSYRNVSVIDLEHASTQPNPAQTCGQGTIPPSLPSPVREQNSHNFYASPDLSGFGPNVHRQKSEQLKNSSGQSHSKTNNRSKDQEHSSSFTSHPRETTPPRKKSKTEPEEYVVVKAEPDDDEDFALHMECIDEKESDNTAEIKDENIQRDLAAETQEDINFLLNVEGPSASHQFNSGDRSWGQRLPTSTVTSQMDTNLSSMAGQGSQGFSNLNLLTHGVDIEDGTMRLTTRVQHPSFIAGQTDSNTPEQRTIPRPSGQDSAAASNAIDPASLLRDLAAKSGSRKPAPLYKSLQPTQVQRGRPVQFPWIPKADTKKKYKCEVCGKQFAQQQHYLGHTNVHFGRRPFKCKICSVGFPYQSQLAAHRKSCKEPGETSSAPNTSTCQICSKSFNEHFKLVRHMVQVHHGQSLMAGKEFICACGAKFDWHAAYKSHRASCPKGSPKDKT
ncbi:zinc finger and BTB domain-containing protein 34-like isoform X5 [Pecten maximus]|uniref:zinc finger and BTB domain-containing protein 34-like isoform X5 n=1 Tax=Pecten maximus TaxID=6579 RepID=UPI001457E93E|nr:zinc finger and BTB domain-containing protein 34-like isoform X5 [Pecten maximus]XP_033742121.1 zinc finger and BTB domain-containing protein 34-like isoform X5 [Pecten maximus]